MPQPRKAPRFGGSPAHSAMIMSNLATELFRHGRIRTTQAKAKSVQPLAEKMITFAKRGDLHSRRQVLRVIRDRDVVHKLFAEIGPVFAERDGGYTRVLKLGPRKGDAAPMALIELVEGVSVAAAGEADLSEAPRRRWSLRRRRGGTLSTSARQREEDAAAAADRGEDLEVGDEEPISADDQDQPEPERVAPAGDEDQVDTSEPEAGPVPADEQDQPAPERPND